jgi:hypothetical protein
VSPNSWLRALRRQSNTLVSRSGVVGGPQSAMSLFVRQRSFVVADLCGLSVGAGHGQCVVGI